MDQIDIDLSERWTRRNGSIALQRHLDRFRNEGAWVKPQMSTVFTSSRRVMDQIVRSEFITWLE